MHAQHAHFVYGSERSFCSPIGVESPGFTSVHLKDLWKRGSDRSLTLKRGDDVGDAGDQAQPQDLDTAERLGTTGRAVAQGIAKTAQGEYETEEGLRERVPVPDVERIIEGWPEAPRNIARQMLDKYGAPNEATPTKLFWFRNGPWKRTELKSDVVVHHWPTVHTDFLAQYIDYRVPPEMASAIQQFDGSILVDRTAGENGARCDSEAANVLALNLVHEMVKGKRSAEDAKRTLEQNKVAHSLGRDAPYAEHLLFEVPQGGTADPDEGHIAGAIAQQTAGKVKDVVTGSPEEPTDRLTDTTRD